MALLVVRPTATMVRYKLKTRYISRAKLLALLKKNHPDMHDSEFRIVVSEGTQEA